MEMNYRKMVEHAKKAGVTNEKTMWESIDSFSDLLEELEESHPMLYWAFMRKQQGIMYHGHYDEVYAQYDVEQIHYTNKAGEKKYGAHWTVDQVEVATAGMRFPPGTTRWDKWVAMNVIYSDTCKEFDDATILKMGHAFFFADEDWPTDTKIWDYMSSKPHKHKSE